MRPALVGRAVVALAAVRVVPVSQALRTLAVAVVDQTEVAAARAQVALAAQACLFCLLLIAPLQYQNESKPITELLLLKAS